MSCFFFIPSNRSLEVINKFSDTEVGQQMIAVSFVTVSSALVISLHRLGAFFSTQLVQCIHNNHQLFYSTHLSGTIGNTLIYIVREEGICFGKGKTCMWIISLLTQIIKVLTLPLEKFHINVVPLNVKNYQQTKSQLENFLLFFCLRCSSCFAFLSKETFSKRKIRFFETWVLLFLIEGKDTFCFPLTNVPLCSLSCSAEKNKPTTIK